MSPKHAGESRPTTDDFVLPRLDDDTILRLHGFACETQDEAAEQSLAAEIARRGLRIEGDDL